MKSYAKKREAVRAVQWTGVMTPEMTALIGERNDVRDGPCSRVVGEDRQLVFANAKGPGRYAHVGDWIVSFSGEDLSPVGDDEFRKIYEEVDETDRPMPPTDAEYEAAGREFVQELDALLVDALRLSREEHPSVFRGRDRLLHRLRHLFDDARYTAARHERHRIRNKIAEELTP